LLALLTKRPEDLDGSDLAEKDLPGPHKNLGSPIGTDLGKGSVNWDDDQEVDIDADADADLSKELEELEAISKDSDERLELITLQNKVLDRLAETLARFKSSPQARTSIDAKHVASTMMIIHQKDGRIKILCSKNEGLDVSDKAFLSDWKDCMEDIARKGVISHCIILIVKLRSFRVCNGSK